MTLQARKGNAIIAIIVTYPGGSKRPPAEPALRAPGLLPAASALLTDVIEALRR